jgi:large subunit ribosomal protein L4
MTLSLTIQNPNGTEPDSSAVTIELPAAVFDVALNVPLIHQVVVAQLAAARQGTASTKTRAEVRGGGKKPYRQKGTGRARQGSTRAPQFAGGGVAHGPKPRSYEQRTPKKMKAAALRAALSDRARHDRVHVVSSLVEGDTPSTKVAAATLARISGAKHVLVVAERSDGVSWQSLRNIAEVHLLEPGQLNTYDVLISDEVVFTRSALEAFLGGPVEGKSATAVAVDGETPTETAPGDAPTPVDVTKQPAVAAADSDSAVETDVVDTVAVEPVAVAPDVVGTVAVAPVAVAPDAVEPDVVGTVAVEPDAVEPDAVAPDVVDTVAVEPVSVEPDAVATSGAEADDVVEADDAEKDNS